jgi:hypothetical protein
MLVNFCKMAGKEGWPLAGYGHRPCVIPGTKKVRSQFLRKIISTLLSTQFCYREAGRRAWGGGGGGGGQHRGINIIMRPTLVFVFWLTQYLSNRMDRQARTGYSVLVKSR